MRTQYPQIPGARDGLSGRQVGHVILRRKCRTVRLGGVIEQNVNLRSLEAGKLDLEVEVDQSLQLYREDLPIPARLLGQSVVGEHVGPNLCGRQMTDSQGRDG